MTANEPTTTTGQEIMFPSTVYAVALLYFSPDFTRHHLALHMLTVSGLGPLTGDEALMRARAAYEVGDNVPAGFTFRNARCVSAQITC